MHLGFLIQKPYCSISFCTASLSVSLVMHLIKGWRDSTEAHATLLHNTLFSVTSFTWLLLLSLLNTTDGCSSMWLPSLLVSLFTPSDCVMAWTGNVEYNDNPFTNWRLFSQCNNDQYFYVSYHNIITVSDFVLSITFSSNHLMWQEINDLTLSPHPLNSYKHTTFTPKIHIT